ncbi:uncharacterized protein LOC131213797 [Anopheles bellator]|uniref:uncharacterized protein LOC131213797 n=1 Tax=Anopheles bellator TaxID=139047 RepID=UPI00264A3A16|nr:uncharacterized protein LOC131213797 [Anopheles bellator]
MSSKGKRSSILKKQPSILGPSSNENGSPTATSSSVNKTAKKIGFHHKKSIKEFVVGENTETIWGNSYEVSTDGTSPRIVTDDSTLTNGHDQSRPNTQNKENVSCVLAQSSVDNAISYPSPNNTWDLSITIADDERRRIRSDNSVCASQSLNTTERLMVEPPCTQPPALAISLNEVRAFDVSPMKMHVSQTAAVKSPRKMIYYNPQADFIVNIADVPTQAVNQVEQQTRGKGPEHNTNLTCFQPNDDCSPKHSMLGNVSETWNSHPQAAFRMKQLRPSFDALADASSDFDNTVAITNTVAKLLEDCPNLTLSVPSNMELDESTVTDVKLPTNALSRARPSFLPSNSRRSCAMEEEQTETTNMPLKSIQKETLSSARRYLNDPVPMDISSPLEGRPALGNFTLDNLSISGDDIQQSVATYRRSSVKSSGLPMDFGISSMSLKLPPNSPEPSTAVGRPKILRPNFPLTTLYNVVSNLKPDPIVSTERDYRETILTATEMDETKQVEYERGKSLAPMDVTHVEQSNIKPVEPKRPSRATVHQLANMSSDDEAILAALSQPRTTILSREMMQLSHNSPPKGTPMEESRLAIATEKRHTVYDQPLIDESLAVPTVDRKRVTTHEPVTMSETKRTTVSEVKHSTFHEKTISEEQMILQQPLGTISNVIHPSASRQTIFCNESMVMDGSEPSISRATSIACVVYSENIDPLSVHAANKTNTVDLKITRATVHDPEPCALDSFQESAKNSSQPYVHHGQEPPRDETAGQMDETATACADRHQISEDNQLTGHEAVAMEEATCVLPKAHHLAYSTAEGKRPSPSSVGQRKSSVCMEETLAPSVVRIERSGPRFDDSSDQPLSPNSESLRGTMCPKQDALDTTMANSVTILSKGQQISEAPEQDQQVKARPRQTILIPQDMEIEEHEQEPAVAKEESFSLPMLVRETTEDCAIRRVPSMATAGRAWTSGMFSTDAFGSKAHKSLSDSVSRVTITKDGAQHKQWLASYTHQPIDISASTSYLRTEPSEIGNISGHMMSMRELIDPLAPELHEICDAVGHRAQGNITKQSKSIAPEPPISDDEFFDAEADQGHPVSGEDTSRAITKSRQLLQSMKFVDVEQLEHTYTAKRVHARLVSSPIVERSEKDPLHVTQLAHRRTAEQMTPQGPSTKKTRVSQSPQATISVASQQHDRGQEIVNSTTPPEPEMVLIKQETEEAVPPLQTLILDPSVFVIDEEDLLDDESKLPSLTDEHLGACEESQQSDADSERSSQAAHPNQRPLKDVSYYREYANVTLNGLDPASSDEEDEPALVAAVPTQLEQGQDPVVEVSECITISDDSTAEPLVVTDDRATVSGRVLESSLANEFIEKLRLKYPSKSRQPCCGVRGDCLCRAKRKLERQKKAIEDVWQWWRNKWPNLPRSPTTNSWEDKWEELRWKISETKQNHIATVPRNKNEPEASTSGKPTRPIRTICRPPFCGMYPETPDPVFLIRNLRQWLAEQQQQASPGATLPEVPRFTKLIANKLATETHWKLDHSEEMILDHLVLRHRTLRSVIITILFEPESVRQERLRQLGRNQEDAQDQRIERIQVEECLREYVHSPNLLLAHIHFIQLTMQTTEQTLRSTYRTAGSLMGLWRHFNDLLERVFDTVNRLLTIVETTNAILSYDVKLERFCVKKWFQRTDEEGFVESNMVLVHFTSLTGIAALGVSFKRPFPEAFHLLPPDTIVHDQHPIVGDLNRSGLMFLECLLWNVSQKYET